MALKHRLDRTDRWGRESGVGPGGLVWLDRGEDFGVEVHICLRGVPAHRALSSDYVGVKLQVQVWEELTPISTHNLLQLQDHGEARNMRPLLCLQRF